MNTTLSGEAAVTVPELAAYLACSVEKVYRMAQGGQIPAFKVGREWRFVPAKVIAHLEAPTDPWAQSARSTGRRRVA